MLALAYAQPHPDRVTELALVAVTTTSRKEVNWITEGVGILFQRNGNSSIKPLQDAKVSGLLKSMRDGLLMAALEERSRAAQDWNAWESTHISLDPNWTPIESRFDDLQGLAFATLITHYWANDGFLGNGAEILANMHRIAHIPAILICGRRDFSGPAITAWKLHQAWPEVSCTLSTRKAMAVRFQRMRCGWRSTRLPLLKISSVDSSLINR